MGYDLQKRLSSLKDQVDGVGVGRLRPIRTFVLSVVFLSTLSLALSSLSPATKLPADEVFEPGTNTSRSVATLSQTELWQLQTFAEIEERTTWLEYSWLGLGASERYRRFARDVHDALAHVVSLREEERQDILFGGFKASVLNGLCSAILRIGFVFIAFWPVWVLSFACGAILFRLTIRRPLTSDLLGVCTRAGRIFYSGIYGPLRSNHSTSGTDLSCPSLACPKKAPLNEALKHPLTEIVRKFGAFNKTNLELIRIILAYQHFPSFVEEERLLEEEGENPSETSRIPSLFTPIQIGTNNSLGEAALQGVSGALEAFRSLKESSWKLSSPQPSFADEGSDDKGRSHEGHSDLVGSSQSPSAASSAPPLAQILVQTLVPTRATALSQLSPQMVATAVLAIEAGKCLVFRYEGGSFVQTSRYPHLQARAVLQSVVPYHHDYNGDERLTIRQAIICSRRHGDFGRAFLPVNMSRQTRALRDWLEVLYAHPNRRRDTGALAELDAHLEELSLNFRDMLSNRLQEEYRKEGFLKEPKHTAWRGLIFKSEVLVPLENIVEFALAGVPPEVLSRICELLRITRKLQSNLSISARLPGFRRQAEEAEKGALAGKGGKSHSEPEPFKEEWLIIRRMLTRYNWLSTRVGDDGVPPSGLVHAIVTSPSPKGSIETLGFDALVPLRQRRFNELFGREWDRTLYQNSFDQRDIEVFVENEVYRETLVSRKSGGAPTGEPSPSPQLTLVRQSDPHSPPVSPKKASAGAKFGGP